MTGSISIASMLRGRRPRDYALLAFAICFTAACIALGFWQLARLQQRKALNAKVIARLGYTPIPVTALPRDTSLLHYRAVQLHGTYDYAHEFTISDRSRNGSPGVYIMTPVRLPETDTAILVNRGWLYAPDGMTADLSRWRESDSATGKGYARPFSMPRAGVPTLKGHPGVYRWIDLDTLRNHVPYPLFPFTVMLEGDTLVRPGVPPRVSPPPLDNGPHLSYAIQWFSFATIAVVGCIFYLRATARGREDHVIPDGLEKRSSKD
jgi:surfeit locus 1 family protein